MSQVSDVERDLIDQAIADGRVSRVETNAPLREQPLGPIERIDGPLGEAPRQYRPPDKLGIREALEWAFATEHASFDFDAIGATSGGVRSGRGVEVAIAERAELGNVTIDRSSGVSSPAEEADILASIVRDCLPWSNACWVAELARGRTTPQLLDHHRKSFQPQAWTHGRSGPVGRKINLMDPKACNNLGFERFGGWGPNASARRNRKHILVHDPIWVTPISATITASMIASARRQYLDWWGYLLEIRGAIGGSIGRIEITQEMPPMTPWSTTC